LNTYSKATFFLPHIGLDYISTLEVFRFLQKVFLIPAFIEMTKRRTAASFDTAVREKVII